MDLRLTDEQEQIRAVARSFLTSECPPSHVRAMQEDARGYSPTLWRRLADLGFLGLALSKEYGGLGAGFVELCLLLEEQGRVLLPSPFVPTVAVAAQAIARHGGDAVRAEHLPAIAGGERVVAVARTSGGGDRDIVRISARDDGYDLDGEAALVEYAHAADLLLVVGKANGDGDLTAVLVAADATGVSCTPVDTIGRDHRQQVRFEGVRADPGAVLGEPGKAVSIAEEITRWGAVARAAEMVGAGERILEMTTSYAKDRTAFGQPIGAFQAIQHHCANMAVDVLTSRFATREAAWRLAEDVGAAEAAAMAKAWVSEAMARVCELGHQVHGAIGFTREHDLHLFAQRIRAAELDYGDAHQHLRSVAEALGL